MIFALPLPKFSSHIFFPTPPPRNDVSVLDNAKSLKLLRAQAYRAVLFCFTSASALYERVHFTPKRF